jgi:hypothetical protein
MFSVSAIQSSQAYSFSLIPPALYRVPTISNSQLAQVTSSNIGCSLGFQMTEELPVKLPVSPTLLHLLDFPFINL